MADGAVIVDDAGNIGGLGHGKPKDKLKVRGEYPRNRILDLTGLDNQGHLRHTIDNVELTGLSIGGYIVTPSSDIDTVTITLTKDGGGTTTLVVEDDDPDVIVSVLEKLTDDGTHHYTTSPKERISQIDIQDQFGSKILHVEPADDSVQAHVEIVFTNR